MDGELTNTFFNNYGKYFKGHYNKQELDIPFRNHPEFPVLLDALARREKHHVMIFPNFPASLYPAFIDALVQNLQQTSTPALLFGAEVIYLDINLLFSAKENKKNIDKAFEDIEYHLHTNNKYFIFVIDQLSILLQGSNPSVETLKYHLLNSLANQHLRLVVFANPDEYHALEPSYISHLDKYFHLISLTAPPEADILALLKSHCKELEAFHQVLIPEEILWYAYALGHRYLSNKHALENALLLLDSSAARASKKNSPVERVKPLVTTNLLMNVLASWTGIPTSNLHIHKFNPERFRQCMEQNLFGQPFAIEAMACGLRTAYAQLQNTPGPFCRFLFAGPTHVGKTKAAIALTQQLFGNHQALFCASLKTVGQGDTAFAKIKLRRVIDQYPIALEVVIKEIPYAVIVFEEIEQATPKVLTALEEILSSGYLYAEGTYYDFRQAIIIVTTTHGTNRILELNASTRIAHPQKTTDLLQLVLEDAAKDGLFSYPLAALVEEVKPELHAHFSPSVVIHCQLVPFIALDKMATEKIIQQKLQNLSKQLHIRHGMELGYAPEVIHHLTQSALFKRNQDETTSLEQLFNQSLYSVIEEALLNEPDVLQKPNQLYLQLTADGQSIHCEWLSATVRHHTS